jgi:glycosyltransferase involved in cell wall biosynthesis
VTDLPTISIVVPNFNGAKTLAATLQSLVDQDYPGKEIIVVDGGSSDASLEIIRKFEKHIAWWTSEKDRGQSHAINKGFAHATGEIVNWLCSDDLLEPGALAAIGAAFIEEPQPDVVLGACKKIVTGAHAETLVSQPQMAAVYAMPLVNHIPQSGCFYRRRLLGDRNPPLDETLHYTMDFDLWCRFRVAGAKWKVLPRVVAVATEDGNNKMSTGANRIAKEIERVYRRYAPPERIPLTAWYRRFAYPLDVWRSRHPGIITEFAVKSGKFVIFLGLAPFYGGLARVRAMNWSVYV